MKLLYSLTITFFVFLSIALNAQINTNSALRINEYTGLGKSQKTFLKGTSNNQGYKALLWFDTRDGSDFLFAQFLDNFDQPIGVNFKVTNRIVEPFSYAVAINQSNEFLISWTEKRESTYGEIIYYRLFDNDGLPKSSIMSVEIEEKVNGYKKPAVCFLPDSSFVMVMAINPWGSGMQGIYIQKFDAAGTTVSSKIMIDEFKDYLSPYKAVDVAVS